MRLHRFYLNTPIIEKEFDISNRDMIRQWRDVFRYNVGSQVILFDGTWVDYLVIITSLRNLGATVKVLKKEKIMKPEIDLWLCVGIIKKDNFELVVQKVTELGVTHIIPILCERSEKKNINMERLQKIAIESSEQSGRGSVPQIHEIVTLTELLKSNILPKEKIVLHLEGQYVGDMLQVKNLKELAVFIGTEGGWSEKELALFKSEKVENVSLGTQVLRAETATIAISSLLLL